MDPKQNSPLAEKLRPKLLDEVVGQQHILGAGQPLRVAIETGNLPSMILWGPPGVGKTTLAHVISLSSNYEFMAISAVLAGVKEIREAVERAEVGGAKAEAPRSRRSEGDCGARER